MATPLDSTTTSATANNSSIQSTKTVTSKFYVQIATALLFGTVMLYAVGFVSTDIAHNAAHDTRHSFAFPCH